METSGNKIKRIDDLAQALASLKAAGKKIVHCHGVFDLLHIGPSSIWKPRAIWAMRCRHSYARPLRQ